MTKQIAAVTGSSRGIGKTVALRLAEVGFKILLLGLLCFVQQKQQLTRKQDVRQKSSIKPERRLFRLAVRLKLY